MNKSKLLAVIAMMFAATLLITSNSIAAEPAPGEGFYTGAFLGYGSGLISADVTSIARAGGGLNEDATFKSDRGGLGLSGIQGGGWLGWGMKTADDLYFGAEISGAGSDEKIELSSTVAIKDDDGVTDITSMSAKRNWVAGGAVRVGYYLNTSTLFSLTGGVAVSQFAVKIGSDKETYYAGGPQVGAQLETQLSKIDPNLSLRMEFVYTDYLTADISGMDGVGDGTSGVNNSELTGSDSAGRVGIVYRF
jgi:hypothetical protein